MLMKRITTKEFIEKARKIHGNKYDYTKVEYLGTNSIIEIICPIHGVFKQRARKHIEGSGCLQCGINKLSKSFRNKEWFINEALKIHTDNYDYSKVDYINFDTKVELVCKEHGSFWQSPRVHLKGHGCPRCGVIKTHDKQRKKVDAFITEASIMHNNFYDYSEVDYKGSHSAVKIICPKHGEFWQTPTKHLAGQGCKKCRLKSQTVIYKYIKDYFSDLVFEYSPEWLYPQRFDMYLEDFNIAIEYNGIQHYYPNEHFGGNEEFIKTIQRDNLKREKCKQNNCTLFEIKYNYTQSDLDNLINNIKLITQNAN